MSRKRKTKPKTMSEDEFIERFKPLRDDESGRFVEDGGGHGCIDLDKALAERRLWTVVSGDKGEPILLQGAHYVNYLYNVVCMVPFLSGEELRVRLD